MGNDCGCAIWKLNLHPRTYAGLLAGWLAIAAVTIAAAPPSASARVHSYIVVDAQTGEVLEARHADERCYPASLAKLMTLYITFQELSRGKLTLGQLLPVSAHAAAQSPVKLGLRRGERISVQSAILSITTKSANDSAVVLAEAIGGTEVRFADLMNRTARRLGMDHTTFRNASGLPNWRQKTTARNMATLALAILHNFPQDYHFFDVRSFDFHGRTIFGHDYLLGRGLGVDGMKTGYTRASGYNIVSSAVRNGRRLVGVVMGGSSARSRDRLMLALLNRGFRQGPAETLTAASEEQNGTRRTATANDLKTYGETRDGERNPVLSFHSVWIVEIGGNFRGPRQVRRALESALHTAPEWLKDTRPVVVRLGRRRYRARFSSTGEKTAWGACRVLRERKFTCRVLRFRSSGVAMASAGR